MTSPPHPTGHRRRAMRWLVLGAGLFVAMTLVVVFARPRPAAYVPGREVETSKEITHSLERRLPSDPGGAPGPGGARSEPALAGTAAPSTGGAPNGEAGGSNHLPGGVTFTGQAEAAGLRFVHFRGKRSSQLPEDMGSGLAWGD